MRSTIKAILAGTCVLSSVAYAFPYLEYEIVDIQVVDLGTMGGEQSVANDINDHGEIVGWSNLRDGSKHGFLWSNDVFEDVTPYAGYVGEAQGINNLTQVVGSLRYSISLTPSAFYRDAQNSLVLLDDAYTGPERGDPDCATGSSAVAINDSGVITGDRYGGCDPPIATVSRAARWLSAWSPWEEILPLPNHVADRSNHGYNINSAGKIVGHGLYGGESFNGGFHWDQWVTGVVSFPSSSSTGTPVWWSVHPYGINESSLIVGSVGTFEQDLDNDHMADPDEIITRALYWGGPGSGSSTLLPTLSDWGHSTAFEINNQAFSVGFSDSRDDRWAVIWHDDIGVQSLPWAPGTANGPIDYGKHCEARAVNNRNASGLIQAAGFCVVGGQKHAVLWNITANVVLVR